MASLKEVRTRIASVKSTQQITSAMKMVAAAKLKKAQNAIIKMRPYASKLQELLENLKGNIQYTEEKKYLEQREPEKVLLVPITSNKGLCGAFNANVIKKVVSHISEEYASQLQQDNLHLLTIGKKATEHFKKHRYQVIDSHDEIFEHLTFENAAPIAEKLMQWFVDGTYDRIELYYNYFKSAATQVVYRNRFLPLEPLAGDENDNEFQETDYIFEPDKEKIISDLVPRSLKIHFYRLLLNSFAAEHAARTAAMQKATDNADELLKDLRLTYNKVRQATITREIIEITTGAQALKQ
ncbi:MAG: ATP synthase F1 subunit gamma [Bacteroidales bacterium]|nr:ATP synthase F1 subunit gamma [Bacteroidales bacterium]